MSAVSCSSTGAGVETAASWALHGCCWDAQGGPAADAAPIVGKSVEVLQQSTCEAHKACWWSTCTVCLQGLRAAPQVVASWGASACKQPPPGVCSVLACMPYSCTRICLNHACCCSRVLLACVLLPGREQVQVPLPRLPVRCHRQEGPRPRPSGELQDASLGGVRTSDKADSHHLRRVKPLCVLAWSEVAPYPGIPCCCSVEQLADTPPQGCVVPVVWSGWMCLLLYCPVNLQTSDPALLPFPLPPLSHPQSLALAHAEPNADGVMILSNWWVHAVCCLRGCLLSASWELLCARMLAVCAWHCAHLYWTLSALSHQRSSVCEVAQSRLLQQACTRLHPQDTEQTPPLGLCSSGFPDPWHSHSPLCLSMSSPHSSPHRTETDFRTDEAPWWN
jgi:hypothetical protein